MILCINFSSPTKMVDNLSPVKKIHEIHTMAKISNPSVSYGKNFGRVHYLKFSPLGMFVFPKKKNGNPLGLIAFYVEEKLGKNRLRRGGAPGIWKKVQKKLKKIQTWSTNFRKSEKKG